MIVGALLLCYLTCDRMLAEMKWNKIAHQSIGGKPEQVLPEYKLLYGKLQRNELFLYNYAAELNVAGRYDESLQIAQECEWLLADYDLQMLMADNCRQLEQYPEAGAHYKKASMMCPVKFMPLYELANLYLATGQTVEALTLARKIVDKEIKIPSATIHAIKNRMRELLNERDNINVPAEAQGRDNDVSQTKTQPRQAFPTVNQTPEGRLPP